VVVAQANPTTRPPSNTPLKTVLTTQTTLSGAVVIHLSWDDITDINEGDVLVAGMTNPQMIPMLKKASAIVTDEGGITCHAAIIARELKKPCIVGTKNATQVLMGGDIVKVDANKGVVHIIKRK
jgi:pyruvate,water dikinase